MGVYFHQIAGQTHIDHKSSKKMETLIGFEKKVTTQNQTFICIYRQS
jgi:hypothetical protein